MQRGVQTFLTFLRDAPCYSIQKNGKGLLWFSFRLPGKRKKRITKKIFFYYYWNVFFQHDSRMIYFFSFTFSPNGVSLTKKTVWIRDAKAFYSLFFFYKETKRFYYYPKRICFLRCRCWRGDLFPPSHHLLFHFPFCLCVTNLGKMWIKKAIAFWEF